MDNIDEFLKQGRERMQQYIDELRDANPTEPVIIEGRPFTPEDFQHLDELNEEMLKQNPPKPYQWGPRMIPQTPWEMMCARQFGRPITLDTPTDEKKPKNNPARGASQKPSSTPPNQKFPIPHNK